jgi:hypothetical protein
MGAIRPAWPRKSSGYARSALGPVPRQKLVDALGWMVGQASEHVGEPSLRIDGIELGGGAPRSLTRRRRRFLFSEIRLPMAVGPIELRGLRRCQPDRNNIQNLRARVGGRDNASEPQIEHSPVSEQHESI